MARNRRREAIIIAGLLAGMMSAALLTAVADPRRAPPVSVGPVI